MSFGQNLQFLRKMRNKMTQEELAEKMNVSRQTVSKWELDAVYPEMNKVIELCAFFNCSMDELIREDMSVCDEAYSNIRTEWVEPLRYIQYAVVSAEPEEDAINHVNSWADKLGIENPKIIGWDFPVVSQEQTNVYNMHGYTAALILDNNITAIDIGAEIFRQGKQKYAAITIRQSSASPFHVIPNAYKALMTYMKANGINIKHDNAVIECFEREYMLDGIDYMDIFIAVE